MPSAGKDNAPSKPRHIIESLTLPNTLLAASLVLFLALLFTPAKVAFTGVALIVAVICIPFAPALAILFYGVILAFSVPINDVPTEVAGFRIYGTDFTVYLVACAAAYWAWASFDKKSREMPAGSRQYGYLVPLVLLNVLWGTVEVVNGILVNSLEPQDAIGDFRRLYVYMLAILIPLSLPIKPWVWKKMPYLFALAGASVVAFGLHRMATGVLYRSYTSHVDSPRILGDNELVALTFLLAYAIAVVAGRAQLVKKLVAIPFGAVSVAFMLLSGWRYGMVLVIAVPFMVLGVIALMKDAKIRRLIPRAVVVAIVVALGTIVVFSVFGDTVNYVWQMRAQRLQLYQQDARVAAYAAALQQFLQKPILGTGLGHQLAYFSLTSTGELLGQQGTTHNIFIDVLYQTGVIGSLLFCLLHALFVWRFIKTAKHIPPRLWSITASLFVGYAATMGLFCMQPSHISALVATYMTMGFLLRILTLHVQSSSTAEPRFSQ